MTTARTCEATWFARSATAGPPRLTLICLPYAGGGAGLFRHWKDRLPADVELWAVRLPGRENRFGEAAFDCMELLVEAVADAVALCVSGPFALFGHSMGAVAAFEVARALRGRDLRPSGLLASGACAPHQPRSLPKLHDLPRDAFITALSNLDGTPPEILASPELLDLLEPTLRADFRAIETYGCADPRPLDIPITVFGGRRDPRTPLASIELWRELAGAGFASILFDGGHFFLNEPGGIFLAALRKTLDTMR